MTALFRRKQKKEDVEETPKLDPKGPCVMTKGEGRKREDTIVFSSGKEYKIKYGNKSPMKGFMKNISKGRF